MTILQNERVVTDDRAAAVPHANRGLRTSRTVTPQLACEETRPDPEWDAKAEAAGADLSQTTFWAETRQRVGFTSHHVRLRAPDGELAGGFLMYTRRLGPGLGVCSVPRGPILFGDRTADIDPLVRALLDTARRQGGRLLLIAPPEGIGPAEQRLAAAGFRQSAVAIAPEATLRLDTRQTEQELVAGMRPTRRRHLARALEQGFEVEATADVELFQRLHASTAVRQGFEPVNLANLRSQWHVLAPRGNCRILIVRYEGVPIAGLWVTCFAGTVTFKLAGWNGESGGPRYANVAAQWAAIQRARTEGAHTYDFGGLSQGSAAILAAGSALPASAHETPDGFKLGFGGTPTLLPRTRFGITPALAHRALAGVVERALASTRVRRLAQRMRSGRS